MLPCGFLNSCDRGRYCWTEIGGEKRATKPEARERERERKNTIGRGEVEIDEAPTSSLAIANYSFNYPMNCSEDRLSFFNRFRTMLILPIRDFLI
jgi:hypothetical protein